MMLEGFSPSTTPPSVINYHTLTNPCDVKNTEGLLRVDEPMEISLSTLDSSGFESGPGGGGGATDCFINELSPLIPSTNSSSSPSVEYHVDYAAAENDHTNAPCKSDAAVSNVVPSRTQRHQSLPVDSVELPVFDGHRRQSSPGCQSTVVSKLQMFVRNRKTANSNNNALDQHLFSASNTNASVSHTFPSPLAPIPQGQELSVVNTQSNPMAPPIAAINMKHTFNRPAMDCACPAPSPTTSRSPHVCKNNPPPQDGPLSRKNQLSSKVCCNCHLETMQTSSGYGNEQQNLSCEVVDHSAAACDTSVKSEHRSGSHHWARELIGRFRTNSITSAPSSDHQNHPPHHHHHQRHHRKHLNEMSARSMTHQPINNCIPDGIDPRRLRKQHEPTSACLQFAKKPLQPHQSQHQHHMSGSSASSTAAAVATSSYSSSPTPIPIGPLSAVRANPALKASSWKSRKTYTRVRWMSHSISEHDDCDPPDLFMSGLNRLSSSAVEEFQGAVDILAKGRLQHFSPVVPTTNRISSGCFVKRASESDRILVISKSLPDSKEDISPCSFGQFDENHIYSTLFRHSTCYDVLPDSGKLIMLDSRLGVVRAIRALLENGVHAAPIWHSMTNRVLGLFSQEFALHLLNALYLLNVLPTAEYSGASATFGLNNTTYQLVLSQMASSEAKPTNMREGLQLWGTRPLGELFRLFNMDMNRLTTSNQTDFHAAYVVSPQTGLRRALSRLLHNGTVRPSPRASTDIAPPPAESWDFCFDMDTRESDPPVNQSSARIRYESLSITPASSVSLNSAPIQNNQQPTWASSHLVVMGPASGNVLGLIGVDRLLAYLRLRLDELPLSDRIMAPIGCIPGIRWADRFRLLNKFHQSTINPDPPQLLMDLPLLNTNTLCSTALNVLSTWLPQLPVLPVISSNDSPVTANHHLHHQRSTSLLGFIAPGDLLNMVLENEPDIALQQPVSRILSKKIVHCRFHQECFCFTHEPIMEVLDRMFRLRSPLLVLYESLTAIDTGSIPVGAISAKDLLRAIVSSKDGTKQSRFSSSSQFQPSWGMETQSTDELFTSIRDSSRLIQQRSVDEEEDCVSSADSTCSAQSTGRVELLPSFLRQSSSMDGSTCSCTCHQRDSIKSMGEDIPSIVPHCFPLDDSVRRPHSHNMHGESSARNVDPNVQSKSTVTRPTHLHVGDHRTGRKQSGGRGDEDDSVFPMD